MPTSRPSWRTRWHRRPVRRTSAPYSSSVSFPDGDLCNAFLRGIQQEPADKDKPKSRRPLSAHGVPGAVEDNSIGHELAAGSGHSSRADVVFCGAPDNRANDPSAIERKPGNEIETCQPDVDESKPSGKRAQHLAIGKDAGQSVENPVQEEAGQRSSDGDVEFLDRF